MRITNNFIQRNALAQLQTNLREVSDAQKKVSTGLRIQKASDDPVAAAQSMHSRGSLRALEQYRRNVESAKSKAALEETTLDDVTSLLSRARELGVSQSGATANQTTRQATAAEVEELLKHAISLGNTSFAGEYIFGGINADRPPFDETQADFLPRVGGVPQVPTGAPRVEIGAGRTVAATHNGAEVFLDSGVLQSLSDLHAALLADDPDAILQSTAAVTSSFDEVQTLIGTTGARVNQLEVTAANLDAFEINLQTLKSDVEEVELEKAISELVSRQTAFEAAMLATSRVMGLTLADYLR